MRIELARARDAEPDVERLRNLLLMYGGSFDRTPDSLLDDLDRILAVLTLDLPAAYAVATALLTRCDPDPTAYQQVVAAWKDAGISL